MAIPHEIYSGHGAGSPKKTIVKPIAYLIEVHFPHYREPIFRELQKNSRYHFKFFYDPKGLDPTIRNGFSSEKTHNAIKNLRWGPFVWQGAAIKLALCGNADYYIFHGNPQILSTWIASIIARLRGKKVIFWTHGWLREGNSLREHVRMVFYQMANGIMVYGHRARDLGAKKGYPARRIHVIGNSLDYDKQATVRANFLSGGHRFANKVEKPFFLIVSRLTNFAGIDIAIEAMAKTHEDCAILVIGDGPERFKLEELARCRGVDLRCIGAIYSEEELAPYFLSCVAVVAPGKVGLLAMHALAYGAAVITHNDPHWQMPESEAIVDGVTGAFFDRGDSTALAKQLNLFLSARDDEAQIIHRREIAIRTIEEGFTPKKQLEFIDRALDDYADHSHQTI